MFIDAVKLTSVFDVQADFTVILDMYNGCLVEAPYTSANVFGSNLHGLIPLARFKVAGLVDEIMPIIVSSSGRLNGLTV